MDQNSAEEGWSRWLEVALVAALVSAGVAVRCYQIDYSLDSDEVFSVELARRHLGEVVDYSLKDRPHPPLHNFLLHFWMRAFGESETSARLLSVILFAAFLVVAYLLYRRLVPPRVALGAIAILVVSPFFVFYGQQARPYALIMLLVSVNMFAFVRVIEAAQKQRRLVLWAVSNTILLHAQYLGGLLIVLEMTFAILFLHGYRRKILLFGAGSIALIGPWFLTAMYGALVEGVDPLPHISWMTRPGPRDFFWFYQTTFGSLDNVPSRWLLLPLAAALAWYSVRTFQTKQLGRKELFLALVALGIPSMVFVLSVWGPKAIFEGRQMAAALVAVVGLISVIASSLKRGMGVALLAFLVAWTTLAMPPAFPEYTRPPWRQVARDLDQQLGAEPVVVLEVWIHWPIRYYRGEERTRIWEDLSEAEKDDRFHLLNRPYLKMPPEWDSSRVRQNLMKTWRWGWGNKFDGHGEVNLYEVLPAER